MRTDRLALLPAPDGSADSSSADGSGGSGGGGCGRVPPDSVVEAAYHEHLVHSEGQHIDLSALCAALKGSGAALLAAVAPNWWRSRSQLRGPGPSCRHGAARLGGARVGATSVAA